ncbi:MAG TPA: hypothetical protein QF753_10090 [Victivallales bacterium]|mgnify:CR=1 FL=1|nr:hypothetical protein [Victivallales bacterium]|tara:strand:+ start:458 stop:604 length:147 start_codon:yes stop_codon:yes gene_type:complete
MNNGEIIELHPEGKAKIVRIVQEDFRHVYAQVKFLKGNFKVYRQICKN